MMKRALFLVLVLAFAVSSAHATDRKVTVLTSLEVTQAVGEILAKGTSIKVLNVIPKGYSMRGQDAYLKKHQKALFKTAASADAVLTVASAWPADPLYKWARRGNIRIVNIDVAKPLDEYGAGVPLVEVDGKSSPFVWRSPANFTRMASIVSDDLCRLSSPDAEVIKANLKALQTALFKLRSKYEAAFVDLEFVDLAAFTSGYTYIADEFGLDILFYELAPESKWSDADVERIAAQIKREKVKGVLCAWEPDALGTEAIRKGGAIPVVMERFNPDEKADPLEALVGWYEGNLSRLVTALNN
ncbi:zinc ABC transporter substrate-binding protein [Pseudodesulfovibrio sp. zrk46]|uniref:metal ABC transporter substrate-binding protein n=1 Tax=Pseudodesulfovibrio sp. zrk46 TaxID=2725288 RepID=UPI001448BE45|nr:zinc ABC transporter substrate-binding protein [Pseudodesulfovibrio sp. zrk46]QJB56955.1 zinc ABC transporter solute-binding protein [Pseudodesulfovibrio sp. zrk46]